MAETTPLHFRAYHMLRPLCSLLVCGEERPALLGLFIFSQKPAANQAESFNEKSDRPWLWNI